MDRGDAAQGSLLVSDGQTQFAELRCHYQLSSWQIERKEVPLALVKHYVNLLKITKLTLILAISWQRDRGY